MRYTLRTAIPDEIDGQTVAFANAFERDERPGEVTVLLIADGRRVVLGVGDQFDLGATRLRVVAIAPQDGGYVVDVEQIDEVAPPPARPDLLAVELAPITIAELTTLVQGLTPVILAALGAPQAIVTAWASETQSTMHREWNGGEIGPVTTCRHVARLAGADGVADVTVTEIRRAPDTVEAEELSAFWRTPRQRAQVFARAEGATMVGRLQGTQESETIMALIAAAVRTR